MAAFDRLKREHGYDCTRCKQIKTRKERRMYRCGWIPREQWIDVSGLTWGTIGHSGPSEWCPGYTTRLPVVQQVARLWGWEKRRSLDLHLRARGIEPPAVWMDLLDIMSAEFGKAEAWEMDERSKKREG